MCNLELKKNVHEMFEELSLKAENIIKESRTSKMAMERISNMVSSRIAAESEGYIVDMYTILVAKIKEDEYFKNPEHLNAFYRLNLRERISNNYHFEISSLETYKKGIEFSEVNQLYMAAGSAAGTFSVGGVLKFTISGLINIPLVVIIAGAVVVGLSTYFTVSEKNKMKFNKAVNKFLQDMENEIWDWLNEIEKYFETQVRLL